MDSLVVDESCEHIVPLMGTHIPAGHIPTDHVQEMEQLFNTKRKLELGYMGFCSLTLIIGLIATTLYDHIHFAVYWIWVACFVFDVLIVGVSLVYGTYQLNRIEEKYPKINVKEKWAVMLEREL